MKLYLTHSSGYDYKKELYEPLKETLGKKHDIFLPHEQHDKGVKSKDIIPRCDIILAEVSQPSTGQGIELGWADSNNKPIICFYRRGSKVSSALRFITDRHIEYETSQDMIEKLHIEIQQITK
jgi:nucleoside 2-deoxyribosyltransferase